MIVDIFLLHFILKSYQMGRNLIEDGLAILSIEKEILEELKYKNLISNFASQKARKIFFK